jgi:hypothetical protein
MAVCGIVMYGHLHCTNRQIFFLSKISAKVPLKLIQILSHKPNGEYSMLIKAMQQSQPHLLNAAFKNARRTTLGED